MTRQRLEVDELLSYAHRRGGSVRVVLHVPGDGNGLPASPDAEVRLRGNSRVVKATAEITTAPGAAVVTFEVAKGKLKNQVWRCSVRPTGSGPFVALQARLLVRPGQPVALLTSPEPGLRFSPLIPSPVEPKAVQLARRLPEPVKGLLRGGRDLVRSGARR